MNSKKEMDNKKERYEKKDGDEKKHTITSIIKAYCNFTPTIKASGELEIKVSLNDADVFRALYSDVLKNSASSLIEQSLHTVTDINPDTMMPTKPGELKRYKSRTQITDRKEITFKGLEKLRESCVRKTKEHYVNFSGPNGLLKYQLAFAKEEVIAGINMMNVIQIRLKYRSSVILYNYPDWRFDFTVVKSVMSDQFQQIKSIRDQFFGKVLKPADFLQILPLSSIAGSDLKEELEIEYVGDMMEPDYINDSLEAITAKILSFLDPEASKNDEYHNIVAEIANLVIPDKEFAKSFQFKNTLKQLVNQPVPLDPAIYRNTILPNLEDYYVSDKADGERCLFYVASPHAEKGSDSDSESSSSSSSHAKTKKDAKCWILTSTLVEIPLSSPLAEKKLGQMVLDAELIEKETKNTKHRTLLVFDILYLTGYGDDGDTTNLPLSERLDLIEKACALLHKAGIGSKSPLLIEPKTMHKLTKANLAKTLKSLWNGPSSRLYEVDGLMFTPDLGVGSKTFKSSNHYFDMIVYKMKPPERQTIDFLVMKAPTSILGVEPYLNKPGHTLMFLFNGIHIHLFKQLGLEEPMGYEELFPRTSHTFFPAAFMPSSNPLAYLYYHPKASISDDQLHNHVAEFGLASLSTTKSELGKKGEETPTWELHKLRSDRDSQVSKGIGFGNAYKTAEIIYEGYRNPLTLEMMISPSAINNAAYFSETKSDIYKPLTRYNGYVKASILRQLDGVDLVIDLAAGKGQDMFVLDSLKVKSVLFIDQDKEALTELSSRKYNLGNAKYYVFQAPPRRSGRAQSAMNVWTLEADLSKPSKETISAVENMFPIKEADGMIMNFAIHYIIKDEASRTNVFDLVNHFMKPGGTFIFTAFDGKRMYDFLEATPKGESLDLPVISELSEHSPRAEKADENDILAAKKFSIRKDYDGAFKPYGLKIGVVHPFSAGEYYEEGLLDLNWVLEAFRSRGWVVLQNSSFGDWLDRYQSFEKRIPLDRSDKVYTSLYSYCSVSKPL